MRKRSTFEQALNLGTIVMLTLALGIWTRECAQSDSGAQPSSEGVTEVPDSVRFEALASGDTLHIADGGPILYLVYRSSCPACRRTVHYWRAIISQLPSSVQVFAVALEASHAGRSYARRQLGQALAIRPLAERDFIARFGILGVPTTLLVDGAGRVSLRLTGVLAPSDVSRVVRRATMVPHR